MKGVIIGGTRTGVGKTTITLALLKGLASAGYEVQSFKVGPGFVDAKLHERLTGRPCYNLDAFLMGEAGVKRDLAKAKADFVIIEGASGLFTGSSSTACIADIIGAPLIITVDASASSESVAATVLGFMQYSSYTPYDVRVVGVVATRVGSDTHVDDIRKALERIGVPLVGLLRRDVWERSRHPSQTRGREPAVTDASLVAICEDLDVASIIGAGTELVVPASVPGSFKQAHVTIGVPLDAAFSFYYRSNIEALEHSARLEYFSPLNERLPAADGLYIGGGFPEARIQQLSANTALLNDIYVKAADGMPIYAEGGGLVYLSRSLAVNDGALYKLAGVIPAEVRMTDNLQAIGHSEVEIVRDCAIAGRGERLRGHEYHYSVAEPDRDARFAYKMVRGTGIRGCDGIVEYNVLASYQHVHVYSMRHGFDRFVGAAQRYSRS
ncbi:MAG: cobyrinate a,c-diamide synthase [Halobacteriota archaeon]